MRKIFNKNLLSLIAILSLFIAFQACQKKSGPNPVLQYLNNSQLKFENKMQRDVIKEAMYDVLTLDKQYLEEKKYKDFQGNEGAWDLKTVISSYFIPNKPGLTLGNNFYDDVKADSVMVFFGKTYSIY